ncbi:MAG: glycosyltransferase family 2 protein [Mogibacterium sp.]|nr:glycosyltransferase family 2 protein [Mogibacterium sp.]
MKKDLITVIVPAYNIADYLEPCVESILEQTYKNLEIILVDDGSKDRSGEICDKIASSDCRIKVIHKAHEGLSSARNIGIENAEGNWLAFVDGDDLIDEGMIEACYRAAFDNGCDIAVCNMLRLYDDGKTEGFYKPTNTVKVVEGSERLETIFQPSVCNKIFRGQLFSGIRFPIGKYYEDTFVYYMLAERAKRIVYTGQDDYYYRYRESSIIGQKGHNDNYFDFAEAVYNMAVYMIKKNEKDFAVKACLSMYAAAREIEKNIKRTDENREKISELRRHYKEIYDYIIGSTDISGKQKLHMYMLRYFPSLYSKTI